MSDNREQARREKALAWERGRIPNTQDISDQNFAGDNSVSPGSWGRIHGFLAGHRAASEEARTMSEKEVLTLLAANHSLKAEIAALREERDRWYFAAGQRQDELNEAHRALEFCTRFIEIERDDNPAHLLAPDFVRRQVRIAKAQYGSTSWAALREEK